MRIFIIVLATMLLTGCDDVFGHHFGFMEGAVGGLLGWYLMDIRRILINIQKNTDKF